MNQSKNNENKDIDEALNVIKKALQDEPDSDQLKNNILLLTRIVQDDGTIQNFDSKDNKQISKNEINKIIKFSKYVLDKAIKKGGSSIRNFKDIKGITGTYQDEFVVYDKKGKICKSKNCHEKIIKLNISNRSTYMCKYCQK